MMHLPLQFRVLLFTIFKWKIDLKDSRETIEKSMLYMKKALGIMSISRYLWKKNLDICE